MLACALSAVGLALLLRGAAGIAVGIVVAVVGPFVLARLEPPAGQQEREALEADLPLALDLLAACLAGGAPLASAAQVVGDAVPGPCGRRLRLVAAALQVGSPASDAWVALAPWTCDGLAGRAVRTLAGPGREARPLPATSRDWPRRRARPPGPGASRPPDVPASWPQRRWGSASCPASSCWRSCPCWSGSSARCSRLSDAGPVPLHPYSRAAVVAVGAVGPECPSYDTWAASTAHDRTPAALARRAASGLGRAAPHPARGPVPGAGRRHEGGTGSTRPLRSSRAGGSA